MPNWCSNQVTIRFKSIEHADEFVDACADILGGKPVPGTLLDVTKPMNLFQYYCPEPDPCPDWYSWRSGNWGTKWPPNIGEILRVSNDVVTITFDTAWGPAIEFFEYCALTHGWCWEMLYIETGMAFAGECAANKDGILYKDEYNDGDEGYATIADSMGVNIEGYDEDDPQSAP